MNIEARLQEINRLISELNALGTPLRDPQPLREIVSELMEVIYEIAAEQLRSARE